MDGGAGARDCQVEITFKDSGECVVIDGCYTCVDAQRVAAHLGFTKHLIVPIGGEFRKLDGNSRLTFRIIQKDRKDVHWI